MKIIKNIIKSNNLTKDLNKTYPIDICYKDMLSVKYQEIALIPSRTASKEMMKLGLSLNNCKRILDEGYDSPRIRKKDTIEKWINKGNKTYNIVITKSTNYSLNEEIYLITHIGKFTRQK